MRGKRTWGQLDKGGVIAVRRWREHDGYRCTQDCRHGSSLRSLLTHISHRPVRQVENRWKPRSCRRCRDECLAHERVNLVLLLRREDALHDMVVHNETQTASLIVDERVVPLRRCRAVRNREVADAVRDEEHAGEL